MDKKVFWSLSILFFLISLLVACSSTPTLTGPPVDPDVTVNTPITLDSQPTEIPSMAAGIPEEELDRAFQTLLDNMVSYNAISLDTLMKLLGEEHPPFLLDVRYLSEVAETGRIEGSIVVPLRDLAKAESIALLPEFDASIVSYCGSGWRCTIAMTILGALGWNDVLSLEESSYSGWIKAGYPILMDPPKTVPLNVALPNPEMQAVMDALLVTVPDGFGSVSPDGLHQAILDLPDLILIDVRRTEEIKEKGGIKNAIHIPLEAFIIEQGKWPPSKDAKILIYSDNGHRSTIAMTILWAYGYKGVASLRGGFNAWVATGYPVVEVALTE